MADQSPPVFFRKEGDAATEPYIVEVSNQFSDVAERTKIMGLRASIEGIAAMGIALSRTFDDIRRLDAVTWAQKMSRDTLDALEYLRRLETGLADGRVVLNGRVAAITEKEAQKEKETLNRIASLFG